MAVDDDLTLDDDEVDTGGRRKSLTHESKGITFFGPRQVRYNYFGVPFPLFTTGKVSSDVLYNILTYLLLG